MALTRDSLFGPTDPVVPLAERLRPKHIDQIVGQFHLLGPGRPLRLAFESGKPHSMIFDAIAQAQHIFQQSGRHTILFVDEEHCFNKTVKSFVNQSLIREVVQISWFSRCSEGGNRG